jgi:multidrug efflux pump subunit AcrA (membrane-fusion protein)
VIPQNPYHINSPLEEVIEEVLVENNDVIEFQQPIVSFEKTQLKNSYDLALLELAVIETELLQAQQSSFQSKQDKALLAQLQKKIQIAQEKVNYQQLLLDESNILSPTSGVAVIKDRSLILGKPFKVGETIMIVADPDQILVEIMIPIQDSITIKKDANINVFLDSDPLNVLQAKVTKFSYEPELTPANILAYRVTGQLTENGNNPRIGLRGSAKIFGEKVHLYFYLFRKPIIFIRQSLGI